MRRLYRVRPMTAAEQDSMFTADVVKSLLAAAGNGAALERNVEAAATAALGVSDEWQRDAHRVLDLHRLVQLRLAALLKRVSEGEVHR